MQRICDPSYGVDSEDIAVTSVCVSNAASATVSLSIRSYTVASLQVVEAVRHGNLECRYDQLPRRWSRLL